MTVYLNDTFTDSNGVLLTNHTPEVGGAWLNCNFLGSPITGTNDIQSNRARVSYNSDWEGVQQDLSISDNFEITANWYCTTDARIGIVWRSNGAGNYMKAQLRQNLSDVAIKRTTGYGENDPVSTSYTFTAGTIYTIRIVVEGENHSLYINDVLKISTTSSYYTTQTYFGIFTHAGAEAYFDSILVESTGSTVHDLTATGVDVGSPVTETPIIGQIHGLTFSGVATESPTVAQATIGQIHSLASIGVDVGALTIGSPSLGQIHVLSAALLLAGNPMLGTPVLGATNSTSIFAQYSSIFGGKVIV